MFKIHKISPKQGQTLQISSSCETTQANISLSNGGSLERLVMGNEEIITNLSHLPYNQTYASSVLFPFANRIKDGKYDFMGENYSLECNEKAGNNALHGLVYNKKFDVVEQHCDSKSALVRLSYCEKELHQGFPFLFTIDLIYKISLNTMTLEVEITNTDGLPFPFTLGWHPYFRMNDTQNSLEFNSTQKLASDERNITTGITVLKTPNPLYINNMSLDDAFVLENTKVAFETQRYRANLTVSEESKYLQLYTPKHDNAIAIEPMTGVSDSFNNGIGLKKLNPKEQFNIKWTLDILLKPKTI